MSNIDEEAQAEFIDDTGMASTVEERNAIT